MPALGIFSLNGRFWRRGVAGAIQHLRPWRGSFPTHSRTPNRQLAASDHPPPRRREHPGGDPLHRVPAV